MIFFSWLLFQPALAQELTIEQCQSAARQNYPFVRQLEIIGSLHDYTIANVQTGRYPQVTLNAQASYQSAVTRVPIDLPNMAIKPLSKDQYRAVADISQSLYDGGTIRRSADLQDNASEAERQQLEVEWLKLRERVNQIFFGILLSDRQLNQATLIRKDLQQSYNKTKAAVENGVALKTNADLFQAELLKAEQRIMEIQSLRTTYLETLALLTGLSLSNGTALQEPAPLPVTNADIIRPELKLFDRQRDVTRSQYALNMTRNNPRAALFLQTGYGRPGLNVLQNEFDSWYIGGLRLSWNLSGRYNIRRDREIMDLNLKLIDVRQDIFVINTRIALRQQEAEIRRLSEFLRIDEELVQVRGRIRETAKAQLDQGVITTNDFLREFNAEDQAKQSQFLHRIQLALANFNYRVMLGQP